MNRETMNALRFDRRLAGRRGWVEADKLASELEQLPDATDKIAPPEEEAAPEAAAPPEPAAPAPTFGNDTGLVGGGFSGGGGYDGGSNPT